jgi:hypothetical protein
MPRMALRPPAPEPVPGAATALDDLVPRYAHRTVHARPVDAPLADVARALHETPVTEARLARVLLAIRTLGRSLRQPPAPLADVGGGETGFVPLVRGEREVVLGYVGRPWPGAEQPPAVEPSAFAALVPDDTVKVGLSLRCAPASYGTLLVTETRIAVGPHAEEPFGRYWAVVRLGSGLVRRSLLAAVARRARRTAARGAPDGSPAGR